MKISKRVFFILAILLLQCVAIGFLILRYENLVTKGVEVRFKCQGYDPYDPLRGRYLRVNVRESTTNVADEIVKEYKSGMFYYKKKNMISVRVEMSTNGIWRVAEAAYTPSEKGIWLKPDNVIVDYSIAYSEKEEKENWGDFEKRRRLSPVSVRADFPSQLFVNEKIAPKADEIFGKKVDEAVAVYRVYNGEIVITDIEIKGESILKLAKEEK